MIDKLLKVLFFLFAVPLVIMALVITWAMFFSMIGSLL